MRITVANPKFKELIEGSVTEITINNDIYNILIFFELAHDPEKIVTLNWANINELSYTDDIAVPGLQGHMLLYNPSGIYDKILSMINDIYLGVYMYNKSTGFEENIYFSIIDSYAIEESRTSTGCTYQLKLLEAFMAEGTTRNFATMDLGVTGESSAMIKLGKSFMAKIGLAIPPMDFFGGKDIYEFLEYVVKLISTDISVNAKTGDTITANSLNLIESDSLKRILDIDSNSIEYFRTKYPADIIGEAIYKNITSGDSCTDVLSKINKYFTYQNSTSDSSIIDAALQGEMATIRSENISKSINPTSLNNDMLGERKLILRSFRDIFTECFQNNQVYEIITNTNNFNNYKTNKKYSFISALTPTGKLVKKYPINLNFVTNEWCDYIVAPLNEADSFTGVLYRFKDIIDCFNKNYLYSVEESNILLDEKISRGITKKEPFFGVTELTHSTFAQTIKSFFTLNEMIEVQLPGNIHRKANEIIFVDDSLRGSGKNLAGAQTTADNSFVANYYFTTRVTHTFRGLQYSNQLFLCNFSNKKSS